ncbi:MAG: hypothetical protein SO170_08540 [Butyribacter sp.]|nr:hypothetical protein [bacterium]MDY3854984.1 hypothetical protein [Butyribacter sp.]
MRRKVLSVLLCTAMTAGMLTGCGGDSKDTKKADKATSEATSEATPIPTNAVAGDADAEDAFVVWGWNEDIQKILDGPFKEDNPDLYKRIVFVNTAGSDFYQTKLDEMLADESNSLYPDLMGLEVDYVLKYVNSDYLLDVADLGIEKSDYADQYSYNLDLGTDKDGKVKALFWQATPGCWQLKADLCEKYLGTTDPEKLQKDYFSTWDKMIDAAKKVNDASKGKVKLLSGYADTFRVFSNAREVGWYKSGEDKITVDDQMKEYMKVAKTLYEGELTYNTDQWGTDWYANMEGDGVDTNAALAYTGCPWFTYWCLKDSWKQNTILVAGPQQFYWGGTGLAATVGCSDKDLAGTIIKYFTCDKDSMVKINALNSDFVNNKKAIEEIMAGEVTCDYLYPDAKQNILEFYLPLADGIDASTATAEDQDINSMWDTQVKEYIQGNKTEDEMMDAFKASVHDKYNYLSAE